jgi:5-methylcytosine-specific restriction endonuclease McrA
MFSVKSAYKLALRQDQERANQAGSSSRPDGDRALFKHIWAARVPPKVWIFAWHLSQEGLATQCNRQQRKLTKHATCQICGTGEEDRYHAVVLCLKTRALRQELRGSWPLPVEEKFLS